MEQAKRIRDIVKFGSSTEVYNAISSHISLTNQYLEYIQKSLARTEKNLLLYNMLKKVSRYLYCLAASFEGPTEQIAFITRSLFELNIFTRYVLINEENLSRFVAESAFDKIQIYEGLLELGEDTSKENVEKLKEEITRLKTIIEKSNIILKKPESINTRAKIVGLEKEYKAMYKLFSKYVHPSSYTINAGYKEIHSGKVRNIFLIHAQLYAGDTFRLIKEATI